MTIVYEKPHCPQCNMTKHAMDKNNIPFETAPLTDDLIEQFKKEGIMQAPVVVTEGKTWGGFQPDLIKELRELISA